VIGPKAQTIGCRAVLRRRRDSECNIGRNWWVDDPWSVKRLPRLAELVAAPWNLAIRTREVIVERMKALTDAMAALRANPRRRHRRSKSARKQRRHVNLTSNKRYSFK
jgi:hypothetical protein